VQDPPKSLPQVSFFFGGTVSGKATGAEVTGIGVVHGFTTGAGVVNAVRDGSGDIVFAATILTQIGALLSCLPLSSAL
jgi:hypothetical protein